MRLALNLSAHVALALGLVIVALLCVPLARLRVSGPILWALDAHEYHLRRALAIARGEAGFRRGIAMPWKSATALVIVIAIVGLILWDLLAYARGGNPATISRMFLKIGTRSLGFIIGVVFIMGVYVGHVFLPQRPKPDEDEAGESPKPPL